MNVTLASPLRRAQDGRIYVTPREQFAARCLPWFLAFPDPRFFPEIGCIGEYVVTVREWAPTTNDEDQWIAEGGEETFAEWAAGTRLTPCAMAHTVQRFRP